MTEEVKATTETETETTAKPEAEKVYKQADVDSSTEKVRQTEAAKRIKAEKDLADLQARSMTEDEKRLADAKAEGRKEVETQLEVAKREAAVLRHLAAKLGPNATDEQLADLAKLAGDGDPKEAVEALAAKWPGFFTTNTTRAPGGGGGRNVTGGGDEEYTPEYLDDMIGKHGPGWMTKERRAKIAAYEAAHNTSGIRPLN